MKKFIAMLLLLATVIPATQAQIVRSRTFGEKKKNPTTWYVRAGLSLNNLTGPGMSAAKKWLKADLEEDRQNYEEGKFDAGFGTRVGYDFEVGFRKNFGNTNVYWGMELGLGMRGGSYHYSAKYYEDDETDKSGASANSYNIKFMPFQVGYLFPVGDKFKIDPHLGVYALYDFKSSSKGWEYTKDEIFDDTEDAGFTRFDVGMKLGIGFWYDRFNLDFSWQRGFMDYMECFPYDHGWYENGEEKHFQSSNFIISLGMSF